MGIVHALLAGLFPPRTERCCDIEVGQRVVVGGQVLPRDLIESTLTGERCVYYQYTVEEFRANSYLGHADGFWRIVERDEAISEFYLTSGGHRVIVCPSNVKVERGRGVPVSPVDLGGIHNRRAQQMLIRPGDYVEVTAQVETVDDLFDEGRGYRATPTRLMLTAPDGDSVRIRLMRTSGGDPA